MAAARCLPVLFALACLLAAVMAFRPGWLAGSPQVARDSRELLPPDARAHLLRSRIRAKQEVIRLLLAGELTLPEAGARFRDLNAHPAGPEPANGVPFCRQVIAWAAVPQGEGDSQEAGRARAARLEAELRAHISAHGGVRLTAAE